MPTQPPLFFWETPESQSCKIGFCDTPRKPPSIPGLCARLLDIGIQPLFRACAEKPRPAPDTWGLALRRRFPKT